MAWLGTWAKRVEISIANTNVDSDLTHFPVLLTLGTSVGTGADDVSFIFDDLASDANRKKIALTKADGTTQIYVEIEKWDDASEAAWLWVSKSDLVVSSSATTTLFLYFDAAQADNTTWVADVGSRTEVWDSSYEAVYHLPEASDAQIIDSTSNSWDSTANTGDLQASGKIDGSRNYDGTVPESDNVGDIDIVGDVTLEVWFKTSIDEAAAHRLIDKTASYGIGLRPNTSNDALFAFSGASGGQLNGTAIDLNDGAWHYAAFVVDDTGNNAYLYLDGSQDSVDNAYTNAAVASANDTRIGVRSDGSTQPWTGDVDEVRISSMNRAAAWTKAAFYTGDDNLLSWGESESIPGAGFGASIAEGAYIV